MCRNNERLPREGPMGQLKDAQQGDVIAAELIAARRRIVAACVINRGVRSRSDGRLVIDRRYAIPTARVREAHEKRKHPRHQSGDTKEFAMASQLVHLLLRCMTNATTATIATTSKTGPQMPPYPSIEPIPQPLPFIMPPDCAQATPVARSGAVPATKAINVFIRFSK